MAVTKIPTAGIADGAVDTTQLADDAVTAAKATGFGKILQIQSVQVTDNISTSSTSFTEISALQDSITCSATSSKVLIFINGGRSSFSGGEAEGTAQLYYQDGTGSFTSITDVIKANNNQSGGFGKPSMSFNYLHSPSSTNVLTYRIYLKTNANTYFLNSDTSTMNITLMEIGA